MVKNETKFWHEIKKNTAEISWTRIENTSLLGTPDLLGYNTNSHFFTVELKVTRSNRVTFSPHQIAFHVRHPNNTFILTKHLASRDVKLYEGKDIMELVACGLKLDACRLGLAACCSYLKYLQLAAWCLRLEAFASLLSFPYNILGVWIPLVFSVYNTFNAAVPALPAISALVALFRRRACHLIVVSRHARRIRPPGRRLLLVIHMIG